MRGTDVLARIGGDEFAVLLPIADVEQARWVAADLVAAVADVRLAGDESARLSTAVGISCFGPGAWASGEALLADADRAMYRAKADGVS
ncbi:MAG: diguanylate cyclase [Solirubrobacterales bacterium]|nr:diguanylate cyclase [Solirubrobacterales bacterium]